MSLPQCVVLAVWMLHMVSEEVSSFVVAPLSLKKSRNVLFMSDIDYEYLPPNADATAPFQSQLESAYPPGTPAGLRGEAVRSALRSTRCIAWNAENVGLLQVEGKGTMDFLSNKLSQTFDASASFKKACLLNPKGRLVDLISVATVSSTQAYMMTSPGHDGGDLFERLDPLVFPMDQVKLENLEESIIFSVASVSVNHVKDAIQNFMVPLLKDELEEEWKFPAPNQSVHYKLRNGGTLTVLPDVTLPACACQGYTFIFTTKKDLTTKVWNALIGEENPEGPVEIKALEYETLRIEAGQPAYGKEITAGLKKDDNDKIVPASPIELHWQDKIDLEKGCYLGQEGIASILKNPRGPPRTLYSVVFDDHTNVYAHESEGDKGDTPNLTELPLEGKDLFVLGSNEKISVGILTSVAEPGGTGDATIVALALVRRADSVSKQMKDMDIQMAAPTRVSVEDSSGSSGMIMPPPMDPLDGLEVIVGGTYTVGTLRSVPSRRLARGRNMFMDNINVGTDNMEGSVMGYRFVDSERTAPVSDKDTGDTIKDDVTSTSNDKESNDEQEMQEAMEEAAKAQAEAEAAAAEAKRKAEKMEALKRRAEEAMARRKKKKQQD